MASLAGQAVVLSNALSNQGFAKESVNLSFISHYDKASCNLLETAGILLLCFLHFTLPKHLRILLLLQLRLH